MAGKRAGEVGVRNQIGSLMLSPDQMEETKFHEMSKICGLYLSSFFFSFGNTKLWGSGSFFPKTENVWGNGVTGLCPVTARRGYELVPVTMMERNLRMQRWLLLTLQLLPLTPLSLPRSGIC